MQLEFADWENAHVAEENHTAKIFAEIFIDAPAEKVWEVLTDWDKMPEWSNFLVGLTGDFQKGGRVTVTILQAFAGHTRHIKLDHTLIHFEEGRLFGWSDPLMQGSVHDNHMYIVEPLPDGRTRFLQTDQFSGILAHFAGIHMARQTMQIYVEFNRALKARVESLAG